MTLRITLADEGFKKEFVLSDKVTRNIKIHSFWKGLKYSKLSYKERMEIAKSQFNLSQKSIESILANIR